MTDAIICEGLTRRYGDLVAVNGLDLVVREGEVFGFLGPNGAGKTTTVRLLNGLLNPSAGRARVLGLDVAQAPLEVRRNTGVLTETPSLYETLSARDNLRFYGELFDVPEGALPQRVDDLLGEFGLTERADDRVGTYSKGMLQRLALARTLLHEPRILFLDEPTAGLDPSASRMVNDLIQRLAAQGGHTIFLCTHNLAEAQRLCDRIGVIDRGTLRAVGSPQELARQIWQTVEVEIDLRGEAPPAVLRALEDLAAVQQHTEEGGGLRLELASEEDLPDVVAALVAAGARIYGVIPREHSLEDIYFEIQEQTVLGEGA
ncbi:MAG: ABC transporter ATP-binding protein [Chloroflexi bacterium]|nr:ABC transporter ATP-binding protein [Chloroflexota bacterium]